MRRTFAHKAKPRDAQARFFRRPVRSVRVVNKMPPGEVAAYLASSAGEQFIATAIRRNAGRAHDQLAESGDAMCAQVSAVLAARDPLSWKAEEARLAAERRLGRSAPRTSPAGWWLRLPRPLRFALGSATLALLLIAVIGIAP